MSFARSRSSSASRCGSTLWQDLRCLRTLVGLVRMGDSSPSASASASASPAAEAVSSNSSSDSSSETSCMHGLYMHGLSWVPLAMSPLTRCRMCSLELQYVLPRSWSAPNSMKYLYRTSSLGRYGSSSCAKRVIVSGDTDHVGLTNDDDSAVAVVGVSAR